MGWEGSLYQRPSSAGASLTLCPGGLLLWEGQPFLSSRSVGPEALCHLKGGRDYPPLGFWASSVACPRATDRFPPPSSPELRMVFSLPLISVEKIHHQSAQKSGRSRKMALSHLGPVCSDSRE